jgi:hypothetical protein
MLRAIGLRFGAINARGLYSAKTVSYLLPPKSILNGLTRDVNDGVT